MAEIFWVDDHGEFCLEFTAFTASTAKPEHGRGLRDCVVSASNVLRLEQRRKLDRGA